jgi:hypothetical protein
MESEANPLIGQDWEVHAAALEARIQSEVSCCALRIPSVVGDQQ